MTSPQRRDSSLNLAASPSPLSNQSDVEVQGSPPKESNALPTAVSDVGNNHGNSAPLSPTRSASVAFSGFLRRISTQSLTTLVEEIDDAEQLKPFMPRRDSVSTSLLRTGSSPAAAIRKTLTGTMSLPSMIMPSMTRAQDNSDGQQTLQDSPSITLSPVHKASAAFTGLLRRISSHSLSTLATLEDQQQPLLSSQDVIVREATLVMSPPVQESLGEEHAPRPLRRINSVLQEKERRVYSSLLDKTSFHERGVFFVIAIIAIVLRFVSVFTVTTYSTMWISVKVWPHHQAIELAKETMSKGYLPEVIDDMYYADAWGSLIMTLLGSLLIPLVRISLVTLCYCLPVEERYHEHRTYLLFVLDHVGRFSLVDLFVMGYMSLFAYKDVSILDALGIKKSISLGVVQDITATLQLELFGTFYAGLVSNLLGTFLTHHLLLMSIPKPPLSGKDVSKRKTLLARFNLSDDKHRRLWKWEPVPMLLALIVSCVCLIHLLVFRARIVTFEATGFTAEMTPAPPLEYNMWTIPFEMPKTIHVDDPQFISMLGVYCLALVYIVVAISLPTLLVLTSLWLLCVPMSKKIQFQWLFASPFWFSWCAVDIFLLITVSQYQEMGSMTEYMTKAQYPALCDFAENQIRTKCAGVDSDFGDGIYSLTALAFCLFFIRTRFLTLYELMGENETSDRLPIIL